MPTEPNWAEDIAEMVDGLRGRGGWSSTAFSRTVLATHRNPRKTAAEQGRLDQYMPGWRTDASDGTLEDLRVGVGALSLLARASAAGYDITTDDTARPLIDVLQRHADDLAAHHRATLAALVPITDGRTRKHAPQRSTLTESLAAAASPQSKQDAPRVTTPRKRPQPTAKLEPPKPTGRHPLTGRWARATRGTIAMDVFVVTVSEKAAAVKAWSPTTGRSRMLALNEWTLVVIDDPRA